MKKVRTIRIDKGVSDNLDSICIRHGDVSWHIEQALNGYEPIRAKQGIEPVFPKKDKPEGISPTPIAGGWIAGDAYFEALWVAGMRKVGKKAAKPIFLKLLKKATPTYEAAFTDRLIDDIKKRLNSNQLGFAEMHPTTYLNGERWNDEVTTHEENRPNQNSGGYRLSAVERVRATNEKNRAARANNRENMGDVDGCLREHPGQPIRGSDAGSVDNFIEGDYTVTD